MILLMPMLKRLRKAAERRVVEYFICHKEFAVEFLRQIFFEI